MFTEVPLEFKTAGQQERWARGVVLMRLGANYMKFGAYPLSTPELIVKLAEDVSKVRPIPPPNPLGETPTPMINPRFDAYAIDKDLQSIARELLLFKLRSGQTVLMLFEKSGSPTMREMVFILHLGKGHPKQLDGGRLPTEGMELWGDGWGIIPVPLTCAASEEQVTGLILAAAKQLHAAAMLAPSTPAVLRITKQIYYRLQHKLAAFKAA